jgi:hypothetical protein
MHHQLLDKGLGRGLTTPTLTHVDDARRGRSMRQHSVAHQIVDQQYGRGSNGFRCFERQQFRVAGASAD